MSKHPVFCSVLKRISDRHQYADDPFAALADFKVILRKLEKKTHHELLRNTPDSLGAKLLIASTSSRSYRNRHLGTLMHCCEHDSEGNYIVPAIDFRAQVLNVYDRRSGSGSTSSTSTRHWSIAYPVKTNIVEQSRGRGIHRMTTAKKEGKTGNT